jgi:hypothetical protein
MRSFASRWEFRIIKYGLPSNIDPADGSPELIIPLWVNWSSGIGFQAWHRAKGE